MQTNRSHPEPRPTRSTAGAGIELDGSEIGQFRSAAFLHAIRQLERFARDDKATLLILGAAGTGKTRLARYAHRLSPRARGPFSQITLSAIDDALASSELFGHVAGAFTDARASRAGLFASAVGGTLFLDEIGKASRVVQHRLLHVIEYGELRPVGSDRDVRVDVRLIAAANESLDDMSASGDFLPDLLARLSVFCVRLPSLRERRADIPVLVERCLLAHAARLGVIKPEVSDDLMRALQDAPWPNNLRQLDATLHRLLVEAEGSAELTVDVCSSDFAFLRTDSRDPCDMVTRGEADKAFAKAGSMIGAAQLLGVHRTTIYRALRRPS